MNTDSKKLIKNIGTYVIGFLLFYAYYHLIAPKVPPEAAIPVNIFFVPALIGVFYGWGIRSNVWVKIVAATTIPIILLVLEGTDPAKPWSGRLIALIWAICMILGVLTYTLYEKRRKRI